jgi:outer membrane lipoprotein SlyB
MVQNVNANNSSGYGKVTRAGETPDGRAAYTVTDPNGKVIGALSIAEKDCDSFERSYKDIMEAAPKLEQYMKTHTEADLKQAQKKGRWITAIGAFTGGIIPAVLVKKPEKGIVKFLATLAGTIVGLIAGAKVAKKVTVPPGAEQMARATENIQKLDIKPL